MSTYRTVSDLSDSVTGLLQGLNLNNVKPSKNRVFERIARELISEIDLPESTGRQSLTLYDGVYDYECPDDLFDTAIVDLAPQGVSRDHNNYVYKQYGEQFDRTKAEVWNGSNISFDYNKGTKVIRISSAMPTARIELDSFSETTGWTASGSASGLTQDSSVYYKNPASVRFTLTGNSTGYLTKTINSADLTNYVGVGKVFLAVKLPVNSLTSATIKIGSSATDYYSVTSTSAFIGAFSSGDWILIPFDLATATTTGTPVKTQIDYCQITFVHSATLTNIYCGDLWISLPYPSILKYQTPAIFLASGSTPSRTITTSADEILLNDASFVIYEHKCAMGIALQQGGTQGGQLVENEKRILYGDQFTQGLIPLFRADNPTQKIKIIGSYYDD